MNRKEGARKSLIHVLQSIDFGQSDVAVRINSVSSGLASDDLRAIFESNVLPRTLVVPKVDIPADIEWVSRQFLLLLWQAILMKFSETFIDLYPCFCSLSNVYSVIRSYFLPFLYEYDLLVFWQHFLMLTSCVSIHVFSFFTFTFYTLCCGITLIYLYILCL